MGQSESKDNAAHLNEKDCEAASDGLQNAAENGPRTLEQEIKELKPHQREALKREKWEGFEHLIIPHTDAAGDPYYMGDIYEGIKLADKWKINDPGPYLQYIKHLSKRLPHLAYLGHWMEVSAAPVKWKYLQHYQPEREKRSKRCKVCVIDFTNQKPNLRDFDDAAKLKKGLDDMPQKKGQAQTRLIVAEDLSRDLVDTLGSYYDVDPMFFLSHIGDYLFHNTRDPWVELPSLDLDARKRPFFCLQYLRGRYFKDEPEFQAAERESGHFNILRRLDGDRSRKRLEKGLLDRPGATVVLTRSKASLWVKPRTQGEPVTAILLVDPTVINGHALWSGYKPFEETPSMESWRQNQDMTVDAPDRKNVFDDVKYWCGRLKPADLELIDRDPRCIALPMYKLILAEWLTTLKYMVAQLGKIEWEFENPHWGETPSDIDTLLKKLSPWRRNVGYYQAMIGESIARLFPPDVRAPLHALNANSMANASSMAPEAVPTPPTHYYMPSQDDIGISALWVDFRNVKRQMDEIQVRLKSIETIATNSINIEESRRAVKQNKNLARLTFLATIFIPLNFTSSFLSVSPDFTKAHTTIWLFFAIGIPITLLSLAVVDLTHPHKNGFLQRRYKKYKAKFKKEPKESIPDRPAEDQQERKPTLKTIMTIPWPSNQRQDTRRRFG